jgi:hypothetical protein
MPDRLLKSFCDPPVKQSGVERRRVVADQGTVVGQMLKPWTSDRAPQPCPDQGGNATVSGSFGRPPVELVSTRTERIPG